MSRKQDRIQYGNRFLDVEAKVMAALIEEDRLTSGQLIERTGIKRTTLCEYLREMVDRGTIHATGINSGRRYSAPAGAEYWYVPPREENPWAMPV